MYSLLRWFTGTVYETDDCPWHTDALPVIAPAATGNGLTVNDPLLTEPPGVVTATAPVVPLPTTSPIVVAVLLVIDATAVPPMVTELAEDQLVPFIVILPPGQAGKPDTLVIVGGRDIV